jgi:hypothetical protein
LSEFQWRYASISEMAAAERIERGDLGTLLRLTLLAPGIVDAILGGHQPEGPGLLRLLAPVSLIWAEQRRALSAVGVTKASCGAHRPLGVGTAPSVAEPVPLAIN